jgi:hypothetical protein
MRISISRMEQPGSSIKGIRCRISSRSIQVPLLFGRIPVYFFVVSES